MTEIVVIPIYDYGRTSLPEAGWIYADQYVNPGGQRFLIFTRWAAIPTPVTV